MSQTMPVSPSPLPPSAAASHAVPAGGETPAGDGAPSGFAAALSTAALRHAVKTVPADAEAGTGATASATDPATALPLAAWIMPWVAPVAASAAVPLARAAPGAGAVVGMPGAGSDTSRLAAAGATELPDPTVTSSTSAALAPVTGEGVEAPAMPLAAPGTATDPGLPAAALRNAGSKTVADATGSPVRGPTPEATAVTSTPGVTPPAVLTTPASPASVPIGGARPDPAAEPGTPARPRAEGPGPQFGAILGAAPEPGLVEALSAQEPAVRHAEGAPGANAMPVTAGTTAPREAPVPTFAVSTPVAGPGWHDDVAKGLAHIVSLRVNEAEIRLNPAHLGPIGIEITYGDNQASVLVTAAQPATRDALEQALPQLRELLAQQGIALGESAVRGEAQPRSDRDTAPAGISLEPKPDAARSDAAEVREARPAGRIDTFA